MMKFLKFNVTAWLISLWAQFSIKGKIRKELYDYIIQDELMPNANVWRRRLIRDLELGVRTQLRNEWGDDLTLLPYSYILYVNEEYKKKLEAQKQLFVNAENSELSPAQVDALAVTSSVLMGLEPAGIIERERLHRQSKEKAARTNPRDNYENFRARTVPDRPMKSRSRGFNGSDDVQVHQYHYSNDWPHNHDDGGSKPAPTPEPPKPDHSGGGGGFGGGGAGGSWRTESDSSPSHSSHSGSDHGSSHDSGGGSSSYD